MAAKKTTAAAKQELLGEPLITSDELAEFLGIEPGTLDQWASRGGGPPFLKIGRFRKYLPSDVRTWLASRRRESDDAA